jgi:thiol-disulfide isomerase/thioredoxin
MKELHDTTVYLAHYYGKGGSMVYIADSARLDKRGHGTFHSTNKDFRGGIYMVLPGREKAQASFEVLLTSGDSMGITVSAAELPAGLQFKNSPENDRFKNYLIMTREFAAGQKRLEGELAAANSKSDTDLVRKKAVDAAKKRTAYMRDFMQQHPKTLLAALFSAMQVPEVPDGAHYLEDGKTPDSTFAFRYYKQHFWDGFDLQDDRLIYTPMFDARIEEYFTRLVLPCPDSMIKDADALLARTRGTKDVFHYTLHWLTRHVEESKVMGMDEVFVYLVETYYMKGDAFWLTPEQLEKYAERARAIAPNVIGNIAPELKIPNVYTQQDERLHEQNGKYTLLVFYSPTCGHCQHELPMIDSIYRASLKNKGMQVFTVATEGDEKAITDFLNKLPSAKKWTNTWDPQHVSGFRSKYDVYSTPTIYLLDDKKIIRGKRLDHTNIPHLIEMMEKSLTKK